MFINTKIAKIAARILVVVEQIINMRYAGHKFHSLNQNIDI